MKINNKKKLRIIKLNCKNKEKNQIQMYKYLKIVKFRYNRFNHNKKNK